MQATWTLDPKSLDHWRALVDTNRHKEVPVRRRAMNVRHMDVDLSRDEIWRVLVGCQVTTQQRSGPNSPAGRFLKSASPALSPRQCRQSASVAGLIEEECSAAGLRRGKTISANLSKIFANLEAGEWDVLVDRLSTLERNTTSKKEREVVNYLQSDGYPGLGQKQSRNFIQWLGLSRYEIPLDSRVLKRMREFGCNFVPKGSALTDETVYLFVQDCLHKVADALGLYPCELDACIFASFDNETEVDESEVDA